MSQKLTPDKVLSIAAFEDDLNLMTQDEMRAALAIAQEAVQQSTAWRDALTACLAFESDVTN
jgi:hypothetical protein